MPKPWSRSSPKARTIQIPDFFTGKTSCPGADDCAWFEMFREPRSFAMIADYDRPTICSMIAYLHIRTPMIPNGWSRGWRSAGAGRVPAMCNRERTRMIRAAAGVVVAATSGSRERYGCCDGNSESGYYCRCSNQHPRSPVAFICIKACLERLGFRWLAQEYAVSSTRL